MLREQTRRRNTRLLGLQCRQGAPPCRSRAGALCAPQRPRALPEHLTALFRGAGYPNQRLRTTGWVAGAPIGVAWPQIDDGRHHGNEGSSMSRPGWSAPSWGPEALPRGGWAGVGDSGCRLPSWKPPKRGRQQILDVLNIMNTAPKATDRPALSGRFSCCLA